MVFRGTRIFSQINFGPAYIKLFNSVMSFVEIFINKSFTFLVSNLTVLQSWFLSEGNVVFFSDMILLIISTFIFFILVPMFASVYLLCIGHCHVFSLEFLAFLYLVSQLLYQGSIAVFTYIFVGGFPVF